MAIVNVLYTNGDELVNETEGKYSYVKFENFVIPIGEIRNKQFSNCIFRNVTFVNCNFHGLNFANCEFHNVRFQTCAFASCTFERSYIFNSNFQNCAFGGYYAYGRRRVFELASFVDRTTFAGYSGFSSCSFFKGIEFKECRIALGAMLNIHNCTFQSLCVKENIEFLKPFITQYSPSHGGFTGWKVVDGQFFDPYSRTYYSKKKLIAKIYIPADAKRVNGSFGRKCRCNKAKVLEYYQPHDMKPVCPDYVTSLYDKNFKYPGIGEYVKPDKFDDSMFTECSNGIHYFLTLQEALEYEVL